MRTRPALVITNVNGTLYGTTTRGGTNGDGIVFKISTAGAFKVLHNFNGSDGSSPTGKLINVGGTLYGTTLGGAAALTWAPSSRLP